MPFDSTLALSENNDVLLGTKDGDGLKVWWLDRENRSWAPLELSFGKLKNHATLGFDGDTVVVINGLGASGATVARYKLASVE
jgi:hypothetical protein